MVCSKFIPKKKELRSLMLQFIYSCPLHVVSIAMAIAIAIWGYARTKLYGKRWNIANALLACGMVMAILCITIMGRTTGERILVLKPFASLAAARTQSEAYRELLMNIFLFFPIWLDAIQRFTTKLGEMAEDRPYGDNRLIAQRRH